jgi:hypothetical protein
MTEGIAPGMPPSKSDRVIDLGLTALQMQKTVYSVGGQLLPSSLAAAFVYRPSVRPAGEHGDMICRLRQTDPQSVGHREPPDMADPAGHAVHDPGKFPGRGKSWPQCRSR